MRIQSSDQDEIAALFRDNLLQTNRVHTMIPLDHCEPDRPCGVYGLTTYAHKFQMNNYTTYQFSQTNSSSEGEAESVCR